MKQRPVFVDLNRKQLKALAHPLRLRLLASLRVDGPSTATRLAERLATNTGKTSYHLRSLAEVGLIAEQTGQGNARDRWWEASHDVSSWTPGTFADDPDAEAAGDWLIGQAARMYAMRLEQWIADRASWSPEWLGAAEMSDLRLRLRPERLRELNHELLVVIRRYLDDPDPSTDPEAVECTVILTSFPDPDPKL